MPLDLIQNQSRGFVLRCANVLITSCAIKNQHLRMVSQGLPRRWLWFRAGPRFSKALFAQVLCQHLFYAAALSMLCYFADHPSQKQKAADRRNNNDQIKNSSHCPYGRRQSKAQTGRKMSQDLHRLVEASPERISTDMANISHPKKTRS